MISTCVCVTQNCTIFVLIFFWESVVIQVRYSWIIITNVSPIVIPPTYITSKLGHESWDEGGLLAWKYPSLISKTGLGGDEVVPYRRFQLCNDACLWCSFSMQLGDHVSAVGRGSCYIESSEKTGVSKVCIPIKHLYFWPITSNNFHFFGRVQLLKTPQQNRLLHRPRKAKWWDFQSLVLFKWWVSPATMGFSY